MFIKNSWANKTWAYLPIILSIWIVAENSCFAVGRALTRSIPHGSRLQSRQLHSWYPLLKRPLFTGASNLSWPRTLKLGVPQRGPFSTNSAAPQTEIGAPLEVVLQDSIQDLPDPLDLLQKLKKRQEVEAEGGEPMLYPEEAPQIREMIGNLHEVLIERKNVKIIDESERLKIEEIQSVLLEAETVLKNGVPYSDFIQLFRNWMVLNRFALRPKDTRLEPFFYHWTRSREEAENYVDNRLKGVEIGFVYATFHYFTLAELNLYTSLPKIIPIGLIAAPTRVDRAPVASSLTFSTHDLDHWHHQRKSIPNDQWENPQNYQLARHIREKCPEVFRAILDKVVFDHVHERGNPFTLKSLKSIQDNGFVGLSVNEEPLLKPALEWLDREIAKIE